MPTDLSRALAVQQSVQQRFWDDRRRLYVNTAGQTSPSDVWSAGIAFSALDAAARDQPQIYRPLLSSYFHSLDSYWDRNEKLPGYEPMPTADGNGTDKYYDDNAWLAITFAEAYALTGERKYLDRAKETTDFVLSGWDDTLGGGIWWREQHKQHTKNNCSNAPSAVACLRLAQYLPPAEAAHYVEAAKKIVGWTRAMFQNPDGRFGDAVNADTRAVNRGTLTYTTALPIRAELMLWRQTGDLAHRTEAEREARASDAFVDPKTGRYNDQVRWSHLLVEADLAVARATPDAALAAHLRQRAHAAVDADYAQWKAKPSDKLIDVASLARELWLVADDDTASGREWWERVDGPVVNAP